MVWIIAEEEADIFRGFELTPNEVAELAGKNATEDELEAAFNAD